MAKKKKPSPAKVAADNGATPTRGARSQALPGMGQVRNTRLDHFCEALAEIRDAMAQGRADEAGNMQGALTEMHDRKLHSYRHAGVELLRVPGEEKLRVRTTKSAATTDTDEKDTEE